MAYLSGDLRSGSWRITVKTERVIEASPIAHTILRATQFYDFVLRAVLQVAEVNREQ